MDGAGVAVPELASLPLLRAAFLAGALSVAGTLVFASFVLPHATARMTPAEGACAERAVRRWAWASLAWALASVPIWALVQTEALAGTATLGDAVGTIPFVLADTLFGRVLLVQAALLIATLAAMVAARRRVPRAAMIASLGTVGAEAAHGHGMAMGGLRGFWPLVDMLHLLAAAIWIGGLVPLLLVVAMLRPAASLAAVRFFSPIGKWSVAILACSAFAQGSKLVGSIAALVGTGYGLVVLGKIALFAVLSGLAIVNRYRLAPALGGTSGAITRHSLIATMSVQILAGLLAILAASVLSGLTPGMDARSD